MQLHNRKSMTVKTNDLPNKNLNVNEIEKDTPPNSLELGSGKEGVSTVYPSLSPIHKKRRPLREQDSDFKLGETIRGQVRRFKYSRRKHRRFMVVKFPDGRTTSVHKRSFDISDTSIDLYEKGDSILLRKWGFLEDRHITKWRILCPRQYNFADPESYRLFREKKGWETLPLPDPSDKKPGKWQSMLQKLSDKLPHLRPRHADGPSAEGRDGKKNKNI